MVPTTQQDLLALVQHYTSVHVCSGRLRVIPNYTSYIVCILCKSLSFHNLLTLKRSIRKHGLWQLLKNPNRPSCSRPQLMISLCFQNRFRTSAITHSYVMAWYVHIMYTISISTFSVANLSPGGLVGKHSITRFLCIHSKTEGRWPRRAADWSKMSGPQKFWGF